MPKLEVEVSEAVLVALEARCRANGRSQRDVVLEILGAAFSLEHGTLFQCSTAGALVQGVSDGAITVGELKRHGDFGLGTFELLDGEMAALGGEYFRIRSDGSVDTPPDDALVPFACIAKFEPQRNVCVPPYASLAGLAAGLDALRDSDNVFVAVRIDAEFERMRTRAICRQAQGTTLSEAAAQQSEFELRAARGSLVGFWSPSYARTINVAGWHLHFIAHDRRSGGHVLDCSGRSAMAAGQMLDRLHLALPETAQFLKARLSGDPSDDLNRAERAH